MFNFRYFAMMGAWGHTPTENDAACNWIESLFAKGLEEQVRNQLNADVREEPEEIRAAAHFVKVLIHADIWPSETRKEFKDLAEFQLQRMLDEQAVTNVLAVSAIRSEIKNLAVTRSR